MFTIFLFWNKTWIQPSQATPIPTHRSSPLPGVSFYKYAFFTLSVSGGRKRAITEARQNNDKSSCQGNPIAKIELIRWIVIPRIAGNHRLELKHACTHTHTHTHTHKHADLSLILADRRINNYFFSCEYNIPLPFPLHPHTDKCSAIICLWHQASTHTEAQHTLWANSEKRWQKAICNAVTCMWFTAEGGRVEVYNPILVFHPHFPIFSPHIAPRRGRLQTS